MGSNRGDGVRFMILLVVGSHVSAQVGVPVDGLPEYEERTLYMLINAARLNPSEYGEQYCDGSNPVRSYSPRTPYIMHHDLNRAAHDHSIDMGECNRMSHTSCDGTSFITRIRAYYGRSGAECIATYRTAVAVLNGWLHSGRGHRDAVMSTGFTTIGCGHAETSRHWWTLDLSTGGRRPGNPLYGGSHIFPERGRISFMVNYYDAAGSESPEVRLVLEGEPTVLSPLFGKETNTTFAVEAPTATRCRPYYFETVEARYPESGVFFTFGEGSCDKDYGAETAVRGGGPVKDVRSAGNGTTAVFSVDGRCLYRGQYPTERPPAFAGGMRGSLQGTAVVVIADVDPSGRIIARRGHAVVTGPAGTCR